MGAAIRLLSYAQRINRGLAFFARNWLYAAWLSHLSQNLSVAACSSCMRFMYSKRAFGNSGPHGAFIGVFEWSRSPIAAWGIPCDGFSFGFKRTSPLHNL
jgi:hypothetical protein